MYALMLKNEMKVLHSKSKNLDILAKYYYIGFLWVIPEKRNQQLASKWLSKVHSLNTNQKYWLTIEEASLQNFYQKNGYKLLAESNTSQNKECILTYRIK